MIKGLEIWKLHINRPPILYLLETIMLLRFDESSYTHNIRCLPTTVVYMKIKNILRLNNLVNFQETIKDCFWVKLMKPDICIIGYCTFVIIEFISYID